MTPLQRAREARKLSQVELAKLCGVQQATISKAERGAPVSRKCAQKLAAYFGHTLTEMQVLYPERFTVAKEVA